MTAIKEVKQKSPLNILWWFLVIALLAGGIWANYHFQMIVVSIRLIAWIVLTIVILAVGLLTTQGKRAFNFAKSARGELRKVVWPTRQETIQTTLLVLALVILLALIIWGLDSFLLWAVGLLTGQRG
jgi:preprotein translocase subunit SecE